MLNRPLVLPLALLYLTLQGWMLLMALLNQPVGSWMSDLMRVIAWAGAIDGLYWMATSRWGAGPPPAEPGETQERSLGSRLLNPLAIRADAISRCEGAAWASLLLRLLAVCGVCLVGTRLALGVILFFVILLAILGLLQYHWLAVAALWCLFFTFMTHTMFVPVACLTVVLAPFLMLTARDQSDVQRGMLALGCAGLSLFWEYRSVDPPPNLIGFFLQVLSTAFNVPQLLPGILLGSAVLSLSESVEPPPQVSTPD